ncbi:MAG: MarR family winged helix-turn-helix transcriptional regulator [Pararhodobacter sp.]
MNAPFRTDTDDDAVDLGALTESVGFMIRMAQVRIYEQFFDEFAGTDVRPGEFTVLWLIDLNPGMRQGALARTLAIKPAHMTKLVQRLVTAGMVRRTVPPEDRRSILLALTAKGRAYLETHRDRFLAVHAAERTALSEAETAQLLTLLHKLAFKDGPNAPQS